MKGVTHQINFIGHKTLTLTPSGRGKPCPQTAASAAVLSHIAGDKALVAQTKAPPGSGAKSGLRCCHNRACILERQQAHTPNAPPPSWLMVAAETRAVAQRREGSSLRLFPKRRPAWDDAVQQRDIHGKQRDRRRFRLAGVYGKLSPRD